MSKNKGRKGSRNDRPGHIGQVAPIDPFRQYRPQEIAANGWIVNNNNMVNYKFILKLINTKKLKAQNGSFADTVKYYMVMGHDIIKYRKEIYGIDSPVQESDQSKQDVSIKSVE